MLEWLRLAHLPFKQLKEKAYDLQLRTPVLVVRKSLVSGAARPRSIKHIDRKIAGLSSNHKPVAVPSGHRMKENQIHPVHTQRHPDNATVPHV